MRIRKRPAAPLQPPEIPGVSVHINITGGLQDSPHCFSRDSSTSALRDITAVKPLKSLYLTAQNNSNTANHTPVTTVNVRKPLTDPLQHGNGGFCAESPTPRTGMVLPALCDNNLITRIPRSSHSLGLITDHTSTSCTTNSSRSKPVLNGNLVFKKISRAADAVRVSSNNSKPNADHHEQSNKSARTSHHGVTKFREAMPELVIPILKTTPEHQNLHSKPLILQDAAVVDGRKSNSTKRRKKATPSSNFPESALLQEPAVNKVPQLIHDLMKLHQNKEASVSSVKDESQLCQQGAADEPTTLKKSKKMKKKTRSRKRTDNQQRNAHDNDNNSSVTNSTVAAQCNRQDGRRWRCNKPVAPGSLYCEYHSVRMSKSFRSKLLQQQQEQQLEQSKQQQEPSTHKQEQSTLQHDFTGIITNVDNYNHNLCNVQELDASVPKLHSVFGSISTSNRDDDLQRQNKRYKQNPQPHDITNSTNIINSTNEAIVTANYYSQERNLIYSTPIDESIVRTAARINRVEAEASTHYKNNDNITHLQQQHQQQGNRIIGSMIKHSPSSSCVIKNNPSSSIRGRWRKKCKPLIRKLNEIQDVAPAQLIMANITNNSTMESSYGGNDDAAADTVVVKDCTVDKLTPDSVGQIKEQEISDSKDKLIEGNCSNITDNDYEEKWDITELAVAEQVDLQIRTDTTVTSSSYSGAIHCQSNTFSDGELKGSFIFNRIQLWAFRKLFQAAAAESLLNLSDEFIADEDHLQKQQGKMYGDGSARRAVKMEPLPKCVLNSDPCEWRTDFIH